MLWLFQRRLEASTQQAAPPGIVSMDGEKGLLSEHTRPVLLEEANKVRQREVVRRRRKTADIRPPYFSTRSTEINRLLLADRRLHLHL